METNVDLVSCDVGGEVDDKKEAIYVVQAHSNRLSAFELLIILILHFRNNDLYP